MRGNRIEAMTMGLWAILFTGCGATVNVADDGSGGGTTVTLESGEADGTGSSVILSDSATSVTVEPASGKAWNEFVINLGSHFLKENICAGRTIFGRLGAAACLSSIDNRFNDVEDASNKRKFPVIATDTDAYLGRGSPQNS